MAKQKSDKLKKLEVELADLERWLDLGLVPKKDLETHKSEIKVLKNKIADEKNKLTDTKTDNEPEEYVAPKRPLKQAFADSTNLGDDSFDSDDDEDEEDTDDSYVTEDVDDEDEDLDVHSDEEDEDDPFSDRNRWRRGVLEDPDADSW